MILLLEEHARPRSFSTRPRSLLDSLISGVAVPQTAKNPRAASKSRGNVRQKFQDEETLSLAARGSGIAALMLDVAYWPYAGLLDVPANVCIGRKCKPETNAADNVISSKQPKP